MHIFIPLIFRHCNKKSLHGSFNTELKDWMKICKLDFWEFKDLKIIDRDTKKSLKTALISVTFVVSSS